MIAVTSVYCPAVVVLMVEVMRVFAPLIRLPQMYISPVRNVSEDQFASLKRERMRYKKTWVAYFMHRNMHSQSQVFLGQVSLWNLEITTLGK